ncbi:hypothetical protein [Nonomuraea sediminis]|uniref:hypothetical protein n=1 Tax=Nonomuraea sediminis TaxID=2835864 RepID=UPI001BDBEEC5|nr:hypothetical protein [Nonomuraea sediminis]
MLGKNRQQGPVPTDAETAEFMRHLAETFVEATREDGYAFDWDPAYIYHLDNYLSEFAAQNPPPDITHSVIMSAGAYLGEMIVRNSSFVWVYHEAENAAAISNPEGIIGFPHNKVAKRVHQGNEHELEAFFKYVVTGEVPHGTTVRTMKPSWWQRLRSRA